MMLAPNSVPLTTPGSSNLEPRSSGNKLRFQLRMNWKLSLALLALLATHVGRAQTPRPSDAAALEQEGKLVEATAAWRAIVAANPRDAAAFASLGFVLSEQAQYE